MALTALVVAESGGAEALGLPRQSSWNNGFETRDVESADSKGGILWRECGPA